MNRSISILLIFISTAFLSQPALFAKVPGTEINNELISFRGRITDAKSGDPLPGASIYIADIKLGAVADDNGYFQFQEIPSGHHLVEISHTGYASIIEHIDIISNLEKNYALFPTVVENLGVVITGVSNAISIRKTPVPITVVKKQELLQTVSTNIIDALAKEPGLSQATTGPGISKPVIRGLGYNRVVVINEGMRQEGQQWGDEHGIEIDEMSIQKAEILKGPASIMYGSDALAGVINLITNTPVAEGVIKGNLHYNKQSNNRLSGYHANLAGNKNGINWNIYGTHKSAGDYKNKFDGRVLNSRFNEKNFGGYIGVNKKWGFSHIIFSGFNQNVGLVEGDRDDASGNFILYSGTPLERIATHEDLGSRNILVPRQSIKHYKLASDNNIALGKSRLKVNLGYQNNLRKEFGNPEKDDETELYFDLKTVNYNVHLVLPEMKEWHTTVGINGMFQNNRNLGEEAIIPDYDILDAGAFIYAQRFFNKITFSSGLRFDNRTLNSKEMMDGSDIRFEAFKRTFTNITGSAGISYEPADYLTLKANVARGFRAPNMAELGSDGAHEGTNRYEYGDKDLKSESSLQFDGGIQVDYEHFSLAMNAFYNKVNDFIFYRKLESVFGGDSLVQVDNEDLMAFQYDQFNASLSGMEITLDIHPHPLDWLHFENTVSFVRGRFQNPLSGTDNLPLIPAPRLLSELRANFRTVGKGLKNFYVKAEMDRNFIQNNPFFAFETETSTPGFTLLNAGIGTDIVTKKKQTIFSLHFAGINLTNTAYQNHLSRLKYTDENQVTGRNGVFNMGRNFSFRMLIPLNFSAGSKTE